MYEITVISQSELEEPDGTADVSRNVIVETENTLMIQSTVAAGVTTGWHHNGNRHVYGYVTAGRAMLEYGPDGEEAVGLDVGDFVYVPPQTIRRVVNSGDRDWVIVICFVGTGPPAVAVDGPQSAE